MRNHSLRTIALLAGAAWCLATSTQAAGAADTGPQAFLAGLSAH